MARVFVHGGVAGTPKEPVSLSYAPTAGAAHAMAVDAVEAAVRMLEDDDRLNAGFGAVLTRAGTVELDAGLMDGAHGHAGAVAGVHVRNPVTLARRVMEATPHVLMIGQGAMELADGLEVLDDTSAAQRDRWNEAARDGSLELASYGDPQHVDTVGAVAIGDNAHLAAASSTGGVFGKLPGRVGDAPVPGAGFFASTTAAVVGTGVGELFLRTVAAARVEHEIERGAHPQEACESVIRRLGRTASFAAGLLAIDAQGRVGAAFRGGSWDVEGPDGRIDAVRLA